MGDLFTQTVHLVMTKPGITKTRQYLNNKLHNELAMRLLSLISATGLPMRIFKAMIKICQSYVKETYEGDCYIYV